MRSLPAGIDQRSPARHPDWLGPDDLALKIEEIREATDWQIPIQLKLGAARVYDDVRMAAKTDPDMIYIDGMEGGTGAGPHLATEETGVPASPLSDRRVRHWTMSAKPARLVWSMPAAFATVATSPRHWLWALTPLPSATPR